MKVFVAGGTGVLGRASLRSLVDAGHKVYATARGDEQAKRVTTLGATPVSVDLFDLHAIRKAIAGSDALIRITTKIPDVMHMRTRKAWSENNRLRTEGARILVDAAIAEQVPVYIHESVTFVYQDGGDRWLGEHAAVDDGGAAILKAALAGEQEAARFSGAGGRGIVLRFGGFYGADAPSTRETMDMARRRMLFQFGQASNYFTSIYVADAGRAVAEALDVPAGIYNVADDNPVRFVEYLQALARASDAPKPRRLPGFLGSLAFGELWNYLRRSQRVSNAKLKQHSRWRPAISNAVDGWEVVASELHKKRESKYAAVR